MKIKILSLIALCLIANAYAQIAFQKHIIDSGYADSRGFIPTDIDGDGFIDLISGDYSNETIYWYKNDGLKHFILQQTIINSLAYDINPIDFDGDDDIDIVWTTTNNEVALSENVDGMGNFSNPQILISPNEDFYMGRPADIDGDDDLDIVCTFYSTRTLKWFENIDGQGNFGGSQLIKQFTIGFDYRLPIITDIDGDDDPDIAVVFYDGIGFNEYAYISFLKNTNGFGVFQETQVTFAGRFVSGILFEDIDGDDDVDLLYNEPYSAVVIIKTNSDGEGNFVYHCTVNDPSVNYVSAFYTSDVDGDEDLDIVCSTYIPDKNLIWYENSDGLATFTESHLIDSYANYSVSRLYSEDIDKDGDSDIIASRYGELIWYENLRILSIEENERTRFSIYPNPTTGLLAIDSETNIIQIDINNHLGQLVLTNTNKTNIDLSRLSQGLYFVTITDENGNFNIKKVLKE